MFNNEPERVINDSKPAELVQTDSSKQCQILIKSSVTCTFHLTGVGCLNLPTYLIIPCSALLLLCCAVCCSLCCCCLQLLYEVL